MFLLTKKRDANTSIFWLNAGILPQVEGKINIMGLVQLSVFGYQLSEKVIRSFYFRVKYLILTNRKSRVFLATPSFARGFGRVVIFTQKKAPDDG